MTVDDQHFLRWDWPNNANDWRHKKATEILARLDELMREGVFTQEDYRELVELIVAYLNGQVISVDISLIDIIILNCVANV